MEIGRFEYPEESFDIPLCVSSGQTFRWRETDGWWTGVVSRRVFRLRREGEFVRCEVDGISDTASVRDYFRLDTDLDELHQRILEIDPSLAVRLARFSGLRVLRWPDAEECLMSFLCTANNNIPRITGMIERLCAAAGDRIEVAGDTHCAFPDIHTIAAMPEEALRGLGFGYRARTLRTAARELTERPEGWLDSLREASYEDAHAALLTLPGVGPKIADCVCLFGLDHLEAVPVDTHLWQAAGAWFMPEFAGKALTESRYRLVGDWFRARFGALAGWAHQYLFYAHLRGER